MNDRPPSTEEMLASLNRQLPFSDEAEKGVLSCLLQHAPRCDESPPPEMFYHYANRTVAAMILSFYGAGRPVDPVTITHGLRDRNLLDKVGGAGAISELFAFIPIPSHFPYYTKIVRDKFAIRQMIGAMVAGIDHLFSHGQELSEETTSDAIQFCQKLVCEAVNDDGTPDIECQPISELLHQVIERSEHGLANPGSIPGVTTGIEEIDDIMGGMEGGCLTIIAAESSDGKSSLARQMLEAAADAGHAVADYTYEMQPVMEARRLLCSQGRIDSTSLKRGMLSRAEQQSLAVHFRKIQQWDISIIDVAGKTIEQICRDLSRRAKRLPHGKKLIACIDYIQLCKTSMASKGNREREVAHITATAKQCAKMTGAHIIMPSQVNKEGEVRESMAIEQDADTLIQILKVKDQATKKQAWKQPDPDEAIKDDRRDLFWKKVRDGERFKKLRVRLVGRHFRFEVIRDHESASMYPDEP